MAIKSPGTVPSFNARISLRTTSLAGKFLRAVLTNCNVQPDQMAEFSIQNIQLRVSDIRKSWMMQLPYRLDGTADPKSRRHMPSVSSQSTHIEEHSYRGAPGSRKGRIPHDAASDSRSGSKPRRRGWSSRTSVEGFRVQGTAVIRVQPSYEQGVKLSYLLWFRACQKESVAEQYCKPISAVQT